MIIQNNEERANFDHFILSIKKNIVEPAIELHEVMLCERAQYSLNFEHYRPEHGDPISAHPDFYTSLDTLDCIVLKPNVRQRLDRHTQLADAGLAEIEERLTKLCTITPALITRHISDQDGLGPIEILVKQSVLVVLDYSDDRQGRTFLHELAFPQYWSEVPED